jgi:penicillin-insensitive murein endopeptidase
VVLVLWPRAHASAQELPLSSGAVHTTALFGPIPASPGPLPPAGSAAAARPGSTGQEAPAGVDTSRIRTIAPTATPAGTDAAIGDSTSCGSVNRGALDAPASLAVEGPAHVIPEPWRSRGLRYGTQELIGLIARAAGQVAQEHPGALLGIADLSRPQGGPTPGHRSHQSGRDADLLYYALASDGSVFPPDQHMPVYTRSGRALYARSPRWTRNIPERYFDLARNWALIKALISDPQVEVTQIFADARIERWLVKFARAAGEPEALIQRAQRILREPRHAEAHNDHMHVRIACSADDVARGRCNDEPAHQSRRRRRRRFRPVVCPVLVEPAPLSQNEVHEPALPSVGILVPSPALAARR